MTTVSVSPAVQAKAEALAAQAHTWNRGRSKQDGTPFYVIPGSKPMTAHWANIHGCTCEGYRRRGVCTHQLACFILQRRSDAQISAKVSAADADRQRSYEALFGEDEPPATVVIERPCAIRGCPLLAGTDSEMCPHHTRERIANVA